MWEDIPISAIAAVAQDGVIGLDGKLPWRIASDFRWFRKRTMRHACVMGRKVLDEIEKPLKGRLNVVMSRSLQRQAEGLRIARSLQEALAIAAQWEREQRDAGAIASAEIMLLGGATVWEQAWPLVDRFYRTEVVGTFRGDTWFPDVDLSAFELTWREDGDPGKSGIAHTFQVLQRKRAV